MPKRPTLRFLFVTVNLVRKGYKLFSLKNVPCVLCWLLSLGKGIPVVYTDVGVLPVSWCLSRTRPFSALKVEASY